MKKPKKWIQKAKIKKGVLRQTVQRRFGKRGFTDKKTIKVEILSKLSKEKGITGKRAKLALKLRRF